MRSLRVRLLLLTLLAVIPVGVVIYASARDRYDETEARTRAQALEMARWSALQYRQSIEATRQFLQPVTQTLALTAAAQASDAASRTSALVGCSTFAAKMIEGYPHIAFLGFAGADGKVVCASTPDAVIADPVFVTKAIAAQGFTVGSLSTNSGTPTIRAGYPLPGSDETPSGVVIADLDLGVLSGVFTTASLPAGSLVLITDEAGTVLAGYPDARAWLGRSLRGRPEFARLLSAPAGAVEDATSLDGEQALVAAMGLSSSRTAVSGPALLDGFVFVLIPRAAAYERLNTQLRNDLLALAGLASVVLAVAWFRSDGLVRQLHSYASVTRRFAAGDHEVRTGPPYAANEVGQLGQAFDDMAGTIQQEIADRQAAEERSRESEQNYRSIFEANPQAAIIYDVGSLAILEVNDTAVAQYGYTRRELLALAIDVIAPDEAGESPEARRAAATAVVRGRGPVQHHRHDGSTVHVRTYGFGVTFGGTAARLLVAEDITERERLESHLQQSQRLESVGRLAGGVAHDFNNLLSVILNYSEFAQDEITEAVGSDPGEPWTGIVAEIHEIETAAHRAAQLTRQLLSFARRDTTNPEPVDVNEVIQGVESMLRRTLGERVRVDTSLDANVPPVLVDRGQFEQVLVNLAVNARDAMPDGGIITIDTAAIDVDASYVAGHADLAPGTYVRMRVSDTGVGMDRETVDRAFEPFFTTKPKGEGTGLGLATVYGIVTQAGGDVNIYSVPGHGTTFSILLPVHAGVAEAAALAPTPPRGHGETVLLVEDEQALLEVGQRILERGGYRVLAAHDGNEAIEIFEREREHIDLLLTDIMMPGMPGQTLADRLVSMSPRLHVIFMSGYAEPVLGAQGSLQPGVVLLEKPFSERVLLARIAEVLGRADAE